MDLKRQQVMCLLVMEKTMKITKLTNLNIHAVTISVAKVKGADAMKISDKILNKVEDLKQTLIPNDVTC